MISFDIETAPLADEHLQQFVPPLDESKYQVTEFDESTVKIGNLKDPQKIKDKIENARNTHAMAMENLAYDRQQDEKAAFEAVKDKAALDPATGQVIAIGFATMEQFRPLAGKEADVLSAFWRKVDNDIRDNRWIIGHNIHEFDLPFLMLRSHILGVDVPQGVFVDPFGKWPKWNSCFLDTRKLWLAGRYGGSCKSSFNHLAAAFGTGGKFEQLDGKDFAKLLVEDREKALGYLREDCVQPLVWATKMGVK